jgi:hypothetical protein
MACLHQFLIQIQIQIQIHGCRAAVRDSDRLPQAAAAAAQAAALAAAALVEAQRIPWEARDKTQCCAHRACVLWAAA